MTEVVAALIYDADRFLICQRPAHKARGLMWEFVGGKVEKGESHAEALIRECREELDVTVTPSSLFMDVIHTYPDITVHLSLYYATVAEGAPTALEHNDLRWITAAEIPLYEFCPADEVILARLMRDLPRCRWCNLKNPLYAAYHDHEWGQLRTDDRYLYEMLLLESFQAGLSWECVLNKREHFRAAFDGFDPARIAKYDEAKCTALASDPGIIRNRRKIAAAVKNAQIFLDIVGEYGSFYGYLCTFTGGRRFAEAGLATSPLSDAISADLRRRGMAFVGSTVVYAYLQAVGIVDSHEDGCFMAKRRHG